MTIEQVFGDKHRGFSDYCRNAGITDANELTEEDCMNYCFATGDLDALSALAEPEARAE